MPRMQTEKSRGVAPLILNLGFRRRFNFTTRMLYPSERTPVPLEYEDGWPLPEFKPRTPARTANIYKCN